MQVVLASGEIVDANTHANADLFRSLKGGKSNFGIVTRVDIKTHAQDTIWGGGIMYPLSETEDAQLEAFWNFKNSDGYDAHAQVELSFISRGPNGSFVSNNHWYGRHLERPASFEHFQKIQPQIMNSMRFETTANFAKELSNFQPREQL
jgi:FAD/FMN-containing dehydrogenase